MALTRWMAAARAIRSSAGRAGISWRAAGADTLEGGDETDQLDGGTDPALPQRMGQPAVAVGGDRQQPHAHALAWPDHDAGRSLRHRRAATHRGGDAGVAPVILVYAVLQRLFITSMASAGLKQ
ncbi:hypothetical protein [Falsiroseomonas sp. HW251]|uniref:hypothetical protein n=1 Tax=Falsiroseomonas sp. HW251 TaxID=3390998 RepID=UPI003D322B99